MRKKLEALLEDQSMWVRRAAAKALGKRGDVDAVAALEAMHAQELERRVQREAEYAIDELDEESPEEQRPAL